MPSPKGDIVSNMLMNLVSPEGFNYPKAIKGGLRPTFRDPEDKKLHWQGDLNGETLKGYGHPTLMKTLAPYLFYQGDYFNDNSNKNSFWDYLLKQLMGR